MEWNIKLLISLILIGYCLCEDKYNYILTVCEKKCQEKSDFDLQQCMGICQRILVGISLGAILFCLSLCTCCFVCSHHKFRRFRLRFDKEFQSLKKQYQQSSTTMGRQQYTQHYQQIVQLFKFSSYKQNFITYYENQQQIEKVIVREKRVSDYRCQIQIEGENEDSQWLGSGEIVCTRKGVICWFFKQTKNDLLKRSKFLNQKSIYVSFPSKMEGLDGQWRSLKKKKQNKNIWKLMVPLSSGESDHQSCLNLHN